MSVLVKFRRLSFCWSVGLPVGNDCANFAKATNSMRSIWGGGMGEPKERCISWDLVHRAFGEKWNGQM